MRSPPPTVRESEGLPAAGNTERLKKRRLQNLMSTRNSYLLLVRSPKKGRPPFGARYDEMEVIQSDTGNKTYSGRILRTWPSTGF